MLTYNGHLIFNVTKGKGHAIISFLWKNWPTVQTSWFWTSCDNSKGECLKWEHKSQTHQLWWYALGCKVCSMSCFISSYAILGGRLEMKIERQFGESLRSLSPARTSKVTFSTTETFNHGSHSDSLLGWCRNLGCQHTKSVPIYRRWEMYQGAERTSAQECWGQGCWCRNSLVVTGPRKIALRDKTC